MLLLGAVGWLLIDAAGGLAGAREAERRQELKAAVGVGSWDDLPRALEDSARLVAAPLGSVALVWIEAVRVVREPARWAWAVGRGLWFLAVWSIVGAALVRIAAPALAGRERPGTIQALRDAAVRAPRLVGPPLSAWLAILILGALAILVGLLFRIPGAGDWVGGGLSVIAIGLAVPIAWLGLVALTSWPLMTATVAVDDQDALEAVSRGYSYVIHRPARYAAGLVLALAVGIGGWEVVRLVYQVVMETARFLLELGAGRSVDPQPGTLLGFWWNAAAWLASGWLASYAWTALTALYLGLRSEIDATPPDSVRPAWAGESTTSALLKPEPASSEAAVPAHVEQGP
jgi:hypothetical protein